MNKPTPISLALEDLDLPNGLFEWIDCERGLSSPIFVPISCPSMTWRLAHAAIQTAVEHWRELLLIVW